MTQQGLTEDFYRHVADQHGYDYSEQERLAIEYAERFVVDHESMDDVFFARLRAHFGDDEIVDLGLCVAIFLGLGRFLRTLGIHESCPWEG